MVKPIILFDIDNTLFDTRRFKDILKEKLINISNVEEKLYSRIASQYSSSLKSLTDFNPDDFLDFMYGKLRIAKTIINRVFLQDKTIYSKSLFPDTINTLN